MKLSRPASSLYETKDPNNGKHHVENHMEHETETLYFWDPHSGARATLAGNELSDWATIRANQVDTCG